MNGGCPRSADVQGGSGVLAAFKKTAPRAASLFLSFALCGCTWNRHYISEPGKSQAIRVEAMDRFYMDLEENATTGYQWYGKCNDPDVDVVIDHEPGRDCGGRVGTPGTAEVTIRIHRGYDGPSTVTFEYKRPWEKEPEKRFTITLYKRTGDCAAWK